MPTKINLSHQHHPPLISTTARLGSTYQQHQQVLDVEQLHAVQSFGKNIKTRQEERQQQHQCFWVLLVTV